MDEEEKRTHLKEELINVSEREIIIMMKGKFSAHVNIVHEIYTCAFCRETFKKCEKMFAVNIYCQHRVR